LPACARRRFAANSVNPTMRAPKSNVSCENSFRSRRFSASA
jgi:hypothetical protein